MSTPTEIKKVSFSKFTAELEAKAKKQKMPYTATIELTYGCNLNCVHCYNPTHKALPEELKTPELYSLIDQFIELGSMNVLFTGGEPLVRRDALDVMRYAKQKGLQILLFTNATLLTPEIIGELEAIQPAQVSTSVYGITEQTYEAVTRVPGSFQKFMCGLNLLLAANFDVLYKMPVMTLNAHELDEITDWFRSRNLAFNYTVDISRDVSGSDVPLKYRLSAEDAAKIRLKYDNPFPAGENFCVRDEPRYLFDCDCGKASCTVTPYGEMNLCTIFPLPKYKLETGSVKEGWRTIVDFVDQASPGKHYECPSCELSPYCEQGTMDAWLEKKDFNACLPYYKEVATKVKEGAKKFPLPLGEGETKSG